jgi:hypothetical protein
MSVVSTAADALKHQGAEMDEDIAFVLRRCCCERLYDEIEQAESLLSKHGDRKSNLETHDLAT